MNDTPLGKPEGTPPLLQTLSLHDTETPGVFTKRHWLLLLIAAQAVLIGWLAGQLHDAHRDGGLRAATVPGTEPAAATIRLAVAPSMPIGDLYPLLASAGVQIVAGPSADGVLSLAPLQPATAPAPAAMGTADSLAHLRQDPRVRYAERIAAVPLQPAPL